MHEKEAFEIAITTMEKELSQYESEWYNGNLSYSLSNSVSSLRITVGVLKTKLELIKNA